MKRVVGCLFDVYPLPKGIKVWILGEDGKPHSFYQDFEIVFYARGTKERLHDLGLYLRRKYPKEDVRLAKETTKRDLLDGPQTLMAIGVSSFTLYNQLSRDVCKNYCDLIYYDVDVDLTVRYAAAHDVFLMGRCEVVSEDNGKIVSIKCLDDPDEIDPWLPKFRILHLRPDTDPSHKPPRFLIAKFGKSFLRLPFDKPHELINLLNSVLSSYDPDIIQSRFGDGWLLPKLLKLSKKTGIPLHLNRDPSVPVLHKKALDFFNYGRAHFREAQIHLRGRCHIDVENTMTYKQYKLIGAIEHTRLSSLPLQETSRRSPGAALASMQDLTAMRCGVLVPYLRQKGEIAKSFSAFMRADRGGLVIQPTPGIFGNLAILDFSSMMPSLIIKYNISSETVVSIKDLREGYELPDIGLKILPTLGLIPQALRPMRDKRIKLKELLKTTPKNDPRYRSLHDRYEFLERETNRESVKDALKWLGVVCYGRLGFAMAKFGNLSCHEAVSFLSRKNTMQARAIAAATGFEPKHLYVDSIFVCKKRATAEDFQALADKIAQETGLPMDFDGTIFPWFAFLGTREDPNIAVANRFYGLALNGNHKIRGIASRRGDTPKFVANIQNDILEILAKETNPAKLPRLLPEIIKMIDERLASLKNREVPPEHLVIRLTLSRELDNYSVLSAPVIAARQLEVHGKKLGRGQTIRFIHTAKAPCVRAWDLPTEIDPRDIDIFKYRELTVLAAYEVLQPLGVTERVLRDWIVNKASYVMPKDLKNPSKRFAKQEVPLLADLPDLHLDVV